MTPTISFFNVCKSEGHLLEGMLESVKRIPFLERICLVDVDSKDDSIAIARRLFDRVHVVRFADSFSELLNLGNALCAPADYSFRLDCDERWSVPVDHLHPLVARATDPHTAFAFRRIRWSGWSARDAVDPTNPDWQPRLIPVKGSPHFRRRIHVELAGASVINAYEQVWIDHFHDCAKDGNAKVEREALYQRLCALEGLAVEGGEPLTATCTCGHLRREHHGALIYATPPFGCERCNDCKSFHAV